VYQSQAEGTLLSNFYISIYLSHTLIDSYNHQLPKSCAEMDYVSKYGGRESQLCFCQDVITLWTTATCNSLLWREQISIGWVVHFLLYLLHIAGLLPHINSGYCGNKVWHMHIGQPQGRITHQYCLQTSCSSMSTTCDISLYNMGYQLDCPSQASGQEEAQLNREVSQLSQDGGGMLWTNTRPNRIRFLMTSCGM